MGILFSVLTLSVSFTWFLVSNSTDIKSDYERD